MRARCFSKGTSWASSGRFFHEGGGLVFFGTLAIAGSALPLAGRLDVEKPQTGTKRAPPPRLEHAHALQALAPHRGLRPGALPCGVGTIGDDSCARTGLRCPRPRWLPVPDHRGRPGAALPLFAWLWGFSDRAYADRRRHSIGRQPAASGLRLRPLDGGRASPGCGARLDRTASSHSGPWALLVAVCASLANRPILSRLWR